MPKKCPRYTQEMLNIGSNYAQDLRKAPQSKWSSLDRPTVKNLSVQTEHQGHRPPWLGVRSMLIPGVLRTPSILAGNQSTKVNRALGPARSSSIVNPRSILDSKGLIPTTSSCPTSPLYPTPRTTSSLAWAKLYNHYRGVEHPLSSGRNSVPPRLTGLWPWYFLFIKPGPSW